MRGPVRRNGRGGVGVRVNACLSSRFDSSHTHAYHSHHHHHPPTPAGPTVLQRGLGWHVEAVAMGFQQPGTRVCG